MKFSSVNYFSAVVAGLVGFFFGYLWYSPLLFGDLWLQGVGIDPESMDGFVLEMLVLLFLSFIIAVVTAVFARALGCLGLGGAVHLSLWLGGGIVAANMIGGYLVLPWSWQVGVIDVAYVWLRMFIYCLFACLWTKKTA